MKKSLFKVFFSYRPCATWRYFLRLFSFLESNTDTYYKLFFPISKQPKTIFDESIRATILFHIICILSTIAFGKLCYIQNVITFKRVIASLWNWYCIKGFNLYFTIVIISEFIFHKWTKNILFVSFFHQNFHLQHHRKSRRNDWISY